MIVNQNHIFRVNVSLEGYEKKTDATACLSREGSKAIGRNKMAFKEQSLTVAEFLAYATKGHTFCNLFSFDPNRKYWVKVKDSDKSYQCYPVYKNGPNKGAMKIIFKNDYFFEGAQTIFVDVDNTRFTDIGEYCDKLILKPTMVYASYSDNVEKNGVKSRRFRMVYVFDRVLDLAHFQRISQIIHELTVNCTAEPMEDYCGTRPSQYMNGVWGNNDIFQTDIIYNPYDILSFGVLPEPETLVKEVFQEGITFTDTKMIDDMEKLSYNEFMHYNSLRYRYVYRTESNRWEYDTYQLTGEEYLQLWYYIEKVQDGNHRRRRLFKNACLRRLMYPYIDPDSLLFNLYVDRERFFDNSDNVITVDVLKRKVINSFNLSWDELVDYCRQDIDFWKEHRPKFILKPGIENSPGMIRKIDKHIRYSEISKVYDSNKSLRENVENGLSYNPRTLYRFCNEWNINTSPGLTARELRQQNRDLNQIKIESFKRLYNPNLSLRENLSIMESHGLRISRGTLSNWIDKYYNAEKLQGLSIPENHGKWDSPTESIWNCQSWSGFNNSSFVG